MKIVTFGEKIEILKRIKTNKKGATQNNVKGKKGKKEGKEEDRSNWVARTKCHRMHGLTNKIFVLTFCGQKPQIKVLACLVSNTASHSDLQRTCSSVFSHDLFVYTLGERERVWSSVSSFTYKDGSPTLY